MTDVRCEGTDFSGNLALSSTLHVQSTALNDVSCSCECSALLQIKPHDFKCIINGHLGKVLFIGLAQKHQKFCGCIREKILLSTQQELLWHSIWPKDHSFYFSQQQSFFPKSHWSRNTTACIYTRGLYRQAGQATMGNSRNEDWLPSAHATLGTSSGFCSASLFFERIWVICTMRMGRDWPFIESQQA